MENHRDTDQQKEAKSDSSGAEEDHGVFTFDALHQQLETNPVIPPSAPDDEMPPVAEQEDTVADKPTEEISSAPQEETYQVPKPPKDDEPSPLIIRKNYTRENMDFPLDSQKNANKSNIAMVLVALAVTVGIAVFIWISTHNHPTETTQQPVASKGKVNKQIQDMSRNISLLKRQMAGITTAVQLLTEGDLVEINQRLSQLEEAGVQKHITPRLKTAIEPTTSTVVVKKEVVQPPKKKIAQASSTGKWAIHLLSYAKKEQAENLIKRLNRKGIPARSIVIRNHGNIRYDVRVIGLASLAAARNYEAQIKANTNLIHTAIMMPPSGNTKVAKVVKKKMPSVIPLSPEMMAKATDAPRSSVHKLGKWALNLVSYPTKAGAKGLIERLRAKDIEAGMIEVHLKEKVRFRVRVTGFASYAEAKAYQAVIQKKTTIVNMWMSKI